MGSDGRLYLLDRGQKRPIPNLVVFRALGYSEADVLLVPDAELARYPTGDPLSVLLKGSGPEIYLMEDGRRRHIPDMTTFEALGFRLEDVVHVSDELLYFYPEGTPLPRITPTPTITLTPTPTPEVRIFDAEYRGCIGGTPKGIGVVKGQVFDRWGNIMRGVTLEITIDGTPYIPATTNVDGWYEWFLTPGQTVRFVAIRMAGQKLSLSGQARSLELKSTSGCYQHVNFRERSR